MLFYTVHSVAMLLISLPSLELNHQSDSYSQIWSIFGDLLSPLVIYLIAEYLFLLAFSLFQQLRLFESAKGPEQ